LGVELLALTENLLLGRRYVFLIEMLYDCSVSLHYLSDSVCNLNTSSAPGFRNYEEPECSVYLCCRLLVAPRNLAEVAAEVKGVSGR
jgi:hypothetical protein